MPEHLFVYRMSKILPLIFRSKKCVFPKCTILGPKLNRRGLVWCLLNSLKALAWFDRPGGLIVLRMIHRTMEEGLAGASPQIWSLLVVLNFRPVIRPFVWYHSEHCQKQKKKICLVFIKVCVISQKSKNFLATKNAFFSNCTFFGPTLLHCANSGYPEGQYVIA